MLRILALFATLAITGCASQALTHSYKGDVYLQSIEIQVEALRDGADVKQSGDLGSLTKIQKFADSLNKAMDPKEQKKVDAQLKEFEQILVQGIREAAGIPLVTPGDADVDMIYDDNAELKEVRFTYKKTKGATLTLYGNIYYGSKSEMTLGGKLLRTVVYEVKPVLNLQIDGRNNKGKPFWQTYVSHRSKEEFRLSNDYVLGLTGEDVEDSDIFLIPLAKGIVKEIRKDLKKK